MADDDIRQYLASLSPAERARLQALADKQNQSLEMMAALIRKQQETKAGIIRNLG